MDDGKTEYISLKDILNSKYVFIAYKVIMVIAFLLFVKFMYHTTNINFSMHDPLELVKKYEATLQSKNAAAIIEVIHRDYFHRTVFLSIKMLIFMVFMFFSIGFIFYSSKPDKKEKEKSKSK